MSGWYILAGLVGGVVLLFLALRVLLVLRIRQQQGQPAPTLPGPPGDRIASGQAALFYFYSPQCGACRTTTPVIQRMAARSPGVFPVDISQDLATARVFGIMATPTYILVDRHLVRQVLIGPQPEQTLTALLAGG